MIVEETFIGEYQEDDFRSKGIVIQAETVGDSILIEYYLKNKEKLLSLIKKDTKKYSPKNLDSKLEMCVNEKDWVPYDKELHSQMTALGFEFKIRNKTDENKSH